MKTEPKFPNQLWHEIFQGADEVPDDADQVISYLLETSGLKPRTNSIIHDYFIEDKSMSNIVMEYNVSEGRVRQIIRDGCRKIRERTRLKKYGVTLKYGWKINREILTGTAEICSVCEKIIRKNDPLFIAPSYRYDIDETTQAAKICCSKECADASVSDDILVRKKRVVAARKALQEEENALQSLQEYRPIPLPFDKALEQVKATETISRTRGPYAYNYEFYAGQGRRNMFSRIEDSDFDYVDSDFRDLTIEDMDLPVHEYHILLRAGFQTVNDVIHAGPLKVRCQRNCGKKAFVTIMNKLREYGVDVHDWKQWINDKPGINTAYQDAESF